MDKVREVNIPVEEKTAQGKSRRSLLFLAIIIIFVGWSYIFDVDIEPSKEFQDVIGEDQKNISTEVKQGQSEAERLASIVSPR